MDHKKESELKTWIMVFLLLAVILFQGYLALFVVGDQGQPDWDFGVVKDVPGESPYAVYPLDNPQHVEGLKEEIAVPGGYEQRQ